MWSFMKPEELEDLQLIDMVFRNRREVGGWLSPEGQYFPANYGHHDEEAEHIYYELTGNFQDYMADSHLLKRGWFRIGSDGSIAHKNSGTPQGYQPTTAQLNMIHALLKITDGVNFEFARNMRRIIAFVARKNEVLSSQKVPVGRDRTSE